MTRAANTDVVVVGAGILGLTTARALLARDPSRHVMVVDKEAAPARHQSGRNSGVIHSGIYYAPASEKAAMVRTGRGELLRFLDTHAVPHEICGKVVVAASPAEHARLDALAARARENDVPVERLDRVGLREREPHIEGTAALLVPSAGIVDYAAVCVALVDELRGAGAEISFGVKVDGASSRDGGIDVATDRGVVSAGSLVNCGGLHCDRVAQSAGADIGGVRIMPFRGEYHELTTAATALVNHLVYPLPDPDFPFLGVHLTRMIDGSVHAGPNAVPALKREGYRWRDVSARDITEIAFSRGTWVLARRHWRTEAGEIHRSLRTDAFLKALRRLCPDLRRVDLRPCRSGVRAQAIAPDGTLLDDFAFAESRRAIHVMNAPSPAATASFAIAATIAERHDRARAT